MTGAAPEVESERFRVVGNKVAWLFVPFAAVAQAVTLPFPVLGARWLTYELLVLTLLAGLSGPWLWRRRGEISRPLWVMLVGFASYVAYALVLVALRPEPEILFRDATMTLPRVYMVVPLVTGLIAMLAGVGLVMAAEPRLRLRILAYGGAAAIPVALVTWPYHNLGLNSWRLTTGQGGAAVIHVVFLLIAALGLACYSARIRPRLFLIVSALAVVAVLATQSRGAFLTLAAWVVMVLIGRRVGSVARPGRLWPVAGIVILVGVFAPLVPGFGRVLSFADPQRLDNLETSLRLWSANATTMIFGTGPGTVWPWYVFESTTPPMRIRNRVIPEGVVLDTPHSTPLAALVETGLVGAALLAVVLFALLIVAWRSRGTFQGLVLGSAMAATLIAFLFDTYLIRNFGISTWWWCVAALVGTVFAQSDPPAGTAASGRSAEGLSID